MPACAHIQQRIQRGNSASLTQTCTSRARRWQSESLAHAHMRRRMPNRLIDPMIRRGKLERHQVKLLRRTGRTQPAHIAEAFSSAIDSRFQRLHQSIVSRASCLVAMHPDQATVHVVVWTPRIYVLHAPNPNDVVPACVLGACISTHLCGSTCLDFLVLNASMHTNVRVPAKRTRTQRWQSNDLSQWFHAVYSAKSLATPGYLRARP